MLDNIMYMIEAIGYYPDTLLTSSFRRLSHLPSPLLTTIGINEQIICCHMKIKPLYSQHFILHIPQEENENESTLGRPN